MKSFRASPGSFGSQRLIWVLLMVWVTGMCLIGCQGTLLSASGKGQTIQPSAQIKIVQTDPQSGLFSDDYVSVKYKYTASGGNLQISGSVRFESAIRGNFLIVQTFDLGLLLGDETGKVLLQQGLTTAVEADVSSSQNFHTTVILPPQAVTMAFTYNGVAFGSGGTSPTSFWADPVVR